MPADQPQAIVMNVQISRSSGPNASIWSGKPMLRDLPGQYYGRVVVEVWDEGESVFFASKQMLEQALSVLQNIDEQAIITITPWSDEPVIGRISGQAFRGRVIAELWNSQAVVAVTGPDSTSALVRRAVNKFLQELQPPSKQEVALSQ